MSSGAPDVLSSGLSGRAAVYGVALNTESAVAQHVASFTRAPYGKPPFAPVLYIKPPNTFAADGALVIMPRAVPELEVCATLALEFGKTACAVSESEALRFVSAFRVALDIWIPHTELFRPAVMQRCQDGFLPLGTPMPRTAAACDLARLRLRTRIGERAEHTWSSAELVRPVASLIAEISQFITFAPGDLLLIGTPGGPPRARNGERVVAEIDGLGRVACTLRAQEPT